MQAHTAVPRIQRPYFRNGPEHRAGADVSFSDIVKVFDFRRIKIGRWVTPAEIQLAANLFFDALADLQLLLQVPAQVISLNGALALSFGTGGEPGSCAFYQPQGRLLALAKNAGGGSLAHEWFHAFDHHIASRFCTGVKPGDFASRSWLYGAPVQAHPLNELLAAGYAQCLLAPGGQEASALFQRSAEADSRRGGLYYALPEELCARAFENMLQRQSLQNSFLVSGTVWPAHRLSAEQQMRAAVYPDATESSLLAGHWLRYFQWLGQALSRTE
ncbi:MAG: CLCA_X family protein [Rheinheimera sp.]|nr:CLCA_X family protein [Rheinheimera sp.]